MMVTATVNMLQVSIILISAIITFSHGSLESVPPAIYDDSGTPLLMACAGKEISITCEFDNHGNAVTLWTFNPRPSPCGRRLIDHNNPNKDYSCGPFMFENVTSVSSVKLGSTAVVTANESLSNTVIECRDNSGVNYNQSETIKLCVIGQSSISDSVPKVNTTNEIEIYWEPWDPVQLRDCALNYSTVAYTVKVTAADGHEEGRVTISGKTSAIINDLKPMLEYDASVSASAIINTDSESYSCDIGSYQVTNFSTPSTRPQGLKRLLLLIIPSVAGSVLIIIIVIVIIIILYACLKRNNCCAKKGKKQNLNEHMKQLTRNELNCSTDVTKSKSARPLSKMPKAFDEDGLEYSLKLTEQNLDTTSLRHSFIYDPDDMNAETLTVLSFKAN